MQYEISEVFITFYRTNVNHTDQETQKKHFAHVNLISSFIVKRLKFDFR